MLIEALADEFDGLRHPDVLFEIEQGGTFGDCAANGRGAAGTPLPWPRSASCRSASRKVRSMASRKVSTPSTVDTQPSRDAREGTIVVRCKADLPSFSHGYLRSMNAPREAVVAACGRRIPETRRGRAASTDDRTARRTARDRLQHKTSTKCARNLPARTTRTLQLPFQTSQRRCCALNSLIRKRICCAVGAWGRW